MKPAPRPAAQVAARFWPVFALPLLLLAPALDGLMCWTRIEGRALPEAALAVLAGWGLLLAVAVFGGALAWHAAGRAATPAARWSWRGAVTLGVVTVLAAAAWQLAPQAGLWLRLAHGDDPLGVPQTRLSPDGLRLQLRGPLGLGAASQLAQALAGAPQAWLLELDSPGGHFHEARAMAALVRARGLHTRSVGACDRACVLVFMAGRARQLMPAARLGLHRLDSGAMLPPFDLLARRWQVIDYRDAGLPEGLIDKAMRASPRSLWAPETDELLTAEVIGVPGRPFDVALPPRARLQPADAAEALASTPAWQALEQRRPGLMATAAARLLQAHAAGQPDPALQVAAQRSIEALLPELLRSAGEPLREAYASLLSEQLQASHAAGGAACRGVLVGDTAARYALPAALVLREARWLVEAAAEPALATPPRRLSPLELEVVQRALGERAAEVLGGLRHPAPGAGCERAAALLSEVLRLPAPERRLAIRLIG
jgi:hypothetical protein